MNAACHSVGFIQLIGHGIAAAVIETMLTAPDEFFSLPDEVDRHDAFFRNDSFGFFAANVWPPQPASMRNALNAYFAEAHRVALRLTDVFARTPTTASSRCCTPILCQDSRLWARTVSGTT